MGNDSDGRPRWPGAPTPGGSQPPGAQPYVPVVRTVPLRAVTPQPFGLMHPPQGPMHPPQGPMHPQGSMHPQGPLQSQPGGPTQDPQKKPAGHALAGTVVMHAEPMHLPPAPAPPPPPPPPPRQAIEEAPFIEVPTRVAMMSDWPTGHPANELFRSKPPQTRRDRRGGRTLLIACGVALGIGAIAAGVFFALRFSSGRGPVGEARAPDASASASPVRETTPTSGNSPEASSAASQGATSAPLSAPSALPSASAEAPPDLSKLLSYEAYLTVASTVSAEVFVQGVLAGRTNTRLVVRCGTRNVRLRKDGTTWLTKGEAIKVPCMKDTTFKVEPD